MFAVAIRGSNKVGRPGSPEALFGGFCAGGDIRFFHQAALAGDGALDDFFTQEYTLNHLIHNYPKPYIAFMDGVVMGGGNRSSKVLLAPAELLRLPRVEVVEGLALAR